MNSEMTGAENGEDQARHDLSEDSPQKDEDILNDSHVQQV